MQSPLLSDRDQVRCVKRRLRLLNNRQKFFLLRSV
jgi:hypothetical protein